MNSVCARSVAMMSVMHDVVGRFKALRLHQNFGRNSASRQFKNKPLYWTELWNDN